MNSTRDETDYLDQLTDQLPWNRLLTSFERYLIGLIVATFVIMVSCLLICVICPRSILRQRYSRRYKRSKILKKKNQKKKND
jgi:hypothetical protein